MVASAANGFMNTNPRTCGGRPFDFHPEYNTAAPQNQVPWAALEGGVLMQQEIGHFESCSGVANPLGFIPYDPQTYWTCMGGSDPNTGGEGPCDCNTGTGAGCTAPPHGAAFYPYWSIGKQAPITGRHSACLWNFGNTIPGVTTNNFGGAAEYGAPNTARFGGTIITPVMPNPQLTSGCGGA